MFIYKEIASNLPLISIITVSYNAVKTIEHTILSVIHQSYKNIEYIILDGGSTDGTVDIIKKYQNHLSYWASEPDKGIYDAMNKGICMARGEWLNFMNCGDCFYTKNVLAEVFSKDYSDFDILYGQTEFVSSFYKKIKCPAPLAEITQNMVFSHQSTFIRSSLMKKDPYDLTYKIISDYHFFLKQYQKHTAFKELDVVVASYDCENGISSGNNYKNFKRHTKELLLVHHYKGSKLYLRLYYKCTIYIVKQGIKSLLPQKLQNYVRYLKNHQSHE